VRDYRGRSKKLGGSYFRLLLLVTCLLGFIHIFSKGINGICKYMISLVLRGWGHEIE